MMLRKLCVSFESSTIILNLHLELPGQNDLEDWTILAGSKDNVPAPDMLQ